VYNPVDDMVPPLADQVTAVLVVPLTAAVNCCALPGLNAVLPGAMLTLTGAPAVIVNVTALENVPDRESHIATLALPALAR
jgi:hypothetical protein